jgi:penicillin amidase
MRHSVNGSVLLALLSFVPGLAAGPADSGDMLLKKARSVLAQIDGEIAVPGLRAPVEVLRDRWGVPHIYAKNADDLFFAQGFVAAQDRLFQMDLWRRQAVGELAEALGERGLEADRFARLVRYRGDMEAEWQSYSADAKRIATAFTRGINAYIDQVGARLPIEFEIMGFAPKKWRPEDVLGRMSGIIMARNFTAEVARARLMNSFGLDKARLLLRTDPAKDFAPLDGLDLTAIDKSVLAGYELATKVLQFKPPETESNNWVVSGARSVSGKPLLANDPHRAIALPALRYLVHLHAPGWNVIGAGEPGLPGVALGHNERIAWGFTIVGTDQADLFVEETNPEDSAAYKVGKRWEKMETRREKIVVKGKTKPVEIELRFTRHGPVIYQDVKRHRAYALKWVGSEPGTAGYLGSLALNQTRDWPGFLRAVEAWKLPTENIVYADVEGNIGWVAAALTPVRRGYDGLLPVPGASGKYDWDGFLAVKDLPQKFNPPEGYVATANHNIVPAGYKHFLALEWAPVYRFARVRERLESKPRFSLDDFKSIQHDEVSLTGRSLARLLNEVAKGEQTLEPYVRLMAEWDGHLSKDSKAGPLYAVWLSELQDRLFDGRVPKDLLDTIRASSVPGVLAILQKPTSAWFGAKPKAARDELVRATFARAVEKTKKLLGDDPEHWSWGKLHTVTFQHPLALLNAKYGKALNVGPFPRGGEANTPNNTRYDPKFQQIHGATYRQLFDLADWDRGLATSAPGQSGQPGSPHYDDLAQMWADGEYFPLAFSRAKVEEVTRHRLWLRPAKQ